MTDREKLLALLAEFGIEPSTPRWTASPDEVILEAKVGGVLGYTGFITVFDFDQDGKFKDVSIWE